MPSTGSPSLWRLRPVWSSSFVSHFSTTPTTWRKNSPSAVRGSKSARHARLGDNIRNSVIDSDEPTEGPGASQTDESHDEAPSMSDWFHQAEVEVPILPRTFHHEPLLGSVRRELEGFSWNSRPVTPPSSSGPRNRPPLSSYVEKLLGARAATDQAAETGRRHESQEAEVRHHDLNSAVRSSPKTVNPQATAEKETPEKAQEQKEEHSVPPTQNDTNSFVKKPHYTKEEKRAYKNMKLEKAKEKMLAAARKAKMSAGPGAAVQLEPAGMVASGKGFEPTRNKEEENIQEEPKQQREESSDEAVTNQEPERRFQRRPCLDGPVVLVVTGVSPSLLESDFFRVARKGRHVDGWVHGLHKVVQAREPITLEPLGQYFLFFDSHAAALQYEDDMRRLHRLNRNKLPDVWQSTGPANIGPLPHLDSDMEAALAAFTIRPPGVLPMLNLESIEALRWELRKHSNSLRKGVLGWDYVNSTSMPYTPAERGVTERHDDDDVDDGVTGGPYEHVLAHLKPQTRPSETQRVLLSLGNNKLSEAKLREAIEADGLRRNLAWRLDRDAKAVMPVILTEALPKNMRSNPHLHTAPVYGRFVLTFANAIEARRFTRCWHKTQMVDQRTERVVTMDVTALW